MDDSGLSVWAEQMRVDPMNRQIEKKKNIIIALLRRHGVKRASLFGSTATGRATSQSDVDLLIEFEDGKSLLDLAGLKLELEEVLGKTVDVLTYRSLHPLLKDRILREQHVLL